MISEFFVHTEMFADWTGVTRFLPVKDPANPDLEPHVEHLIPGWVNLVVIITLLGTSIVASIIAQKRERQRGMAESDEPHSENGASTAQLPDEAKKPESV
jgi:hypothetical protein